MHAVSKQESAKDREETYNNITVGKIFTEQIGAGSLQRVFLCVDDTAKYKTVVEVSSNAFLEWMLSNEDTVPEIHYKLDLEKCTNLVHSADLSSLEAIKDIAAFEKIKEIKKRKTGSKNT